MFNIWEQSQVSYSEQANQLFNLPAWQQGKTERQQIIPFLGAGVSVSARKSSAGPTPLDKPPDLAQIEQFCVSLGIEGDSARLFLRMAVFLAARLHAAEKDSGNFNDDQLLDDLQNDASPPTARELARLFSNLSTYSAFKQVVDGLSPLFPKDFINATESQQIDMLKLLARVTRIADPPDPLSSITGYYESKTTRRSLWTNLHLIISGKNKPTLTHKLLAAAAKRYFEQPRVWQDYLILTTNYDCLMEDALDLAKVDYVVLAPRKSDQKVLVRFSNGIENAEELTRMHSGNFYPDNLYLQKDGKMVVVCKMHGCLNPKLTDKDDGLVISDNDYVNYISQMNSVHGTLPSYVNTLMQDKPFLFLGYSLADWNVRSVFETIRKKRGQDFGGQDYAVTSYLGDYELEFFKRNGVAILKTDLNTFVRSVTDVLQKLKGHNSERWGTLVDNILSSLPEMASNQVANANS